MADGQEPVPGHLTLLNPEQYRAVTTTEGPLLILAGAGSGKTRVLTRRIAHVLHNGTDPKNVLAVTFTNKAAAEMKERVIELVGEIGSKVWVSTFHSSCCRILRQDIENLGWTKRFAIYDDDDQLRMVKGIITELGFDPERADPRALLRQIDHYKNRMYDPDSLIAEKRSHEREPLIQVWRGYAEQLQAADAVDFNDLIGLTVRLFREHPDVLAKWQDTFHYVMVDEYQDTNRGQYDLLTLLASKHRNLAVVGDDDQSIYGFRGADISIIRGFQNDYPEAAIIRLEQNYRSTKNILALANHVIAIDENRIAKQLWTEAPPGAKVRFIVADTAIDEAKRVAGGIQLLARRGISYDDMAIIYRTNATSRPFELALGERRIPYRIIGGKKFYARREVRDALSYLRLIVNPADDAAFLRVVNVPPRGIGAKTLAKLREEATTRGMPLLRTARGFRTGKRAQDGLAELVTLIDDLTDAARTTQPPALLMQALEDSGYAEMLRADTNPDGKLSRDAQGRLANLEELAKDALAFELPSALTPLDVLTAWLDRIALTAATDEESEGGQVTLMTVHNAKGLEYPVVFVVQMVEGVFPHAKSEDRGIEEERRLAYVAFTRAKERLFVTRSRRASSFDERTRDTLVEPSRFLFGLPLEVCEGDLPDGTPAGARADGDSIARSKLRDFLERRKAVELPADTEVTLIDIEHPGQLSRGVRVHHPDLGVGEIQSVSGPRAIVAFGGRSTRVALSQMQLVVE
ncbi:MAG: UvrD-helicase domain-containing protein [Myxococcota bacterium]